MSYLARLKNLKSAQTDTAKPTKPGFAGFAAPIPAPFENSQGVWGGVGKVSTIPANDPASPESLKPRPAPTSVNNAVNSLDSDTPADWQTLDRAYQSHQVGCPTCIAGGKGYGLRCGTGAALWSAYAAVDMPVHGKVSTRVRTDTGIPASTAHKVDQPLSDAENTRNAARLALFDARGLGVDLATRLVDKLLTRDREGDRRGVCAECRQLVGNGPGRWRCADQSPTHINELAGANLGAAFVHLNLHRCNSMKGAAS